jgi:hypothetical protein
VPVENLQECPAVAIDLAALGRAVERLLFFLRIIVIQNNSMASQQFSSSQYGKVRPTGLGSDKLPLAS